MEIPVRPWKKVEAIGFRCLVRSQPTGRIKSEGRTCPQSQDQKLLGQLMSQAHNHLKSLGVSCDLSDLLVATALEHGALGARCQVEDWVVALLP